MADNPKIQVRLSPFEKLHVLRGELEARRKELASLEAEIRDKLQILETQRYLEGLSPYYAANPLAGLASREDIDGLEARRAQLYDLVKNIEAAIPAVMEATKGGGQVGDAAPGTTPPPPPPPAPHPGPARRAKFDSFDDFARAKNG